MDRGCGPGRRNRQGQHRFPFRHVHELALLLEPGCRRRRGRPRPGTGSSRDRSLRVEHEQRPLAEPVIFSIGVVRRETAPLGSKSASNRKRIFRSLAKARWHHTAVYRKAEQLRVVLLELRHDLLIERHLVAAHRAPVRRVEGQDHRLPDEVRWRDPLFRGGGQAEIGRGRARAGAVRPACDEWRSWRVPSSVSNCPSAPVEIRPPRTAPAISRPSGAWGSEYEPPGPIARPDWRQCPDSGHGRGCASFATSPGEFSRRCCDALADRPAAAALRTARTRTAISRGHIVP